jgi:hypothetical protein
MMDSQHNCGILRAPSSLCVCPLLWPPLSCHRAVPAAMHQRPRYRQDLRAPRRLRFQLRDAFTGSGRRGLCSWLRYFWPWGCRGHIARRSTRFFYAGSHPSSSGGLGLRAAEPVLGAWWPVPWGCLPIGGLYDTKSQGAKHLRAGKLLQPGVPKVRWWMIVLLRPQRSICRDRYSSSAGVKRRGAWWLGLRRGWQRCCYAPLTPGPRSPPQSCLIAPAPTTQAPGRRASQRAQVPVIGAALATTANSPTTYQAILASGATLVLAESIPSADLASELYWKLRRAGIAMQLIPTSPRYALPPRHPRNRGGPTLRCASMRP